MNELAHAGSSLPFQSARDYKYDQHDALHASPENIIGLGHYAWLLRKAWWKIALAVVFFTAVAVGVAYSLHPMYESTARLAIDLKSPSTVVGQPASEPSGSDADQYFNTELQVIQSDTVLRPVVHQYQLDRTSKALVVPAGVKAEDASVMLKNLTVAHPASSYLLNITYRSPDAKEAAAVANAVAQSYILRGREMRAHAALEESDFMEKQIVELKKTMDDSVSALAAYEKELGVMDPEEKTTILTARLAQLNAEYTEAQNDRIKKEVAFRAVQTGSTAAIEVSQQATALVTMEERSRAAQQKMESVKAIYGTANPEYKRAAGDLAEVTRQLGAAQAEIGNRIQVEYNEAKHREDLIHTAMLGVKGQSDALNTSSIQYRELKREAEANKTLYAELFRKVKEAGINGAFENNVVRITDIARPQLVPGFPNKKLIIGMAFLFSLVFSIIAVLLADHTDKTLRDPDQARRQIGADVLGILPKVLRFAELSPLAFPQVTASKSLVKSSRQWFGTTTFYQEAARALLSTVLSGPSGRKLRCIMVTSAAKNEGKSSCIAHLAALHASQGYRTLLIDADMRCPTQQTYFQMPHELGLADVIRSGTSFKELRRPVAGLPLLDLVTAGTNSARFSDQAGRAVASLLREARPEYDLIFIDAPPMLCFAEPIQLAGLADGVLVICRAGDTSQRAVNGVLTALRRLNARTLGVVLNQVQPHLSQSYEPYQTYYRSLELASKQA